MELPFESLSRRSLHGRVDAIGTEATPPGKFETMTRTALNGLGRIGCRPADILRMVAGPL